MLAIIKPGTVRAEVGSVIKSDDYQSLDEPKNTVAQAKKIYNQTEQEREQILADAKKQGYEQGLAKANQELVSRHLDVVKNSLVWIENLEQQIAKVIESTIRNLIDEMGPVDVLAQLVKKALENLQNQSKIDIYARTNELEQIKEKLAETSKASGMHINYSASTQVGANEVMIESPVGIIRVDLQAMLDELGKAVNQQASKDTSNTKDESSK